MKRTAAKLMLLTIACLTLDRAIPIAGAGEQVSVNERDATPIPKPTLSDFKYGDHPRHKLHFWKADSQQPTAMAVHIHGGGWNGGTRMNSNLKSTLPMLLEAKISVASLEYRLIRHAVAEGVDPPVKAPMHDCARALQVLRSKSEEWNIDPARVAVFGGSAGACTSLWLAFHDDLADPDSEDPIARQSTRPLTAAVFRAQTTLDPAQMKEWIPNGFYGGHAFGLGKPGKENRERNIEEFLAHRDALLTAINEYSPYTLATSDDPAVYMHYTTKPAMGQNIKDPTHSSNYGVKLQERLQSIGVQNELVYPDAPVVVHPTVGDYLINRLK